MRLLILVAGLNQAGSGFSCGAEPVLTHLHPAGIEQGTKASVKLTGKFDPWPCQVWTDAPGIVFTPTGDAGTFEVSVSAATAPGPHLIRAFNSDGASAPVAMVVDMLPQTLEVEPNNDFRVPQVLAGTNATINGKLDKTEDVDSFRVSLQHGQTIVIRVEAYVLAAGFDAMLRVVDSNGVTLAYNHDHTSMDPFLAFKAPDDGGYIIQIMGQKYPASSDVRFAGGEDCVYRLHCSTGPVVSHTWPLMVAGGRTTQVGLEGWNLPATQVLVDHCVPPPFPVIFSDVGELTETPGLQTLEVPCAISGRIEAPGDQDQFSFITLKDTPLELSVSGPDQGSAIDAWLKVLDKDGKELASMDDQASSRDPRLHWTAPADGTYTVSVGELTQQGGPDYYYRLLLARAAPSLTASTAWHSSRVEAGKSSGLKVTVTLANGFHGKLSLQAAGLPPGITAPEVEVPDKGGEVTISLQAAPDAPRASQLFRLVLKEAGSGNLHPVEYSMVSASEDNGVPQGYQSLLIHSTGQFWLTVLPPPPPPSPPAPPAAPAE